MEYELFMQKIAKYGFTEDDTKQGGVAFLSSKRDLKAGVDFVHDDEEPIGILAGEFFYTGPGTTGVNNAILILTNERLIKADKKLKNTDMTQFMVDDINSSNFNTSFLSSQVTIKTTSGDITVSKVKKTTAQKFNDELVKLIREARKALKSPKVIQGASSSMDELIKAKELLEAGVITQKEFDAIKKKHI